LHVQVGRFDEATFFVPVCLVRTPSWANGTKETRNVTCYLRIVCHPIATLNILRSAQRARMKSNRSDCDVMKRRI